jgi:hypothetical protein
MGESHSLHWISLAMAVGVAAVAATLAMGVWWERRTREPGLPDSERKYFLIRDLRRGLGIVLLAMIAPGLYVGSRLPTYVAESGAIHPDGPAESAAGPLVTTALEAHPNRLFLAVWMGVFGSIVLLLGLAMIDWIATRRYAQRHRREMNRERLDLLREALRHAHSAENDLADGRSADPA